MKPRHSGTLSPMTAMSPLSSSGNAAYDDATSSCKSLWSPQKWVSQVRTAANCSSAATAVYF